MGPDAPDRTRFVDPCCAACGNRIAVSRGQEEPVELDGGKVLHAACADALLKCPHCEQSILPDDRLVDWDATYWHRSCAQDAVGAEDVTPDHIIADRLDVMEGEAS